MPESALAKKMKLRAGRAAVITAPAGYLKALAPLPVGVKIAQELKATYGWIQIFVENEAELRKAAPRALRALTPDGMLWSTFPKGTSKIQTDLTRDKGWDTSRAPG